MIRSRVLKSRLRSQVFVTMHDGSAFGGVMWEADDKALVLRNAEAIKAAPDSSNLPLDGEVVLLMFDIAFIQRP